MTHKLAPNKPCSIALYPFMCHLLVIFVLLPLSCAEALRFFKWPKYVKNSHLVFASPEQSDESAAAVPSFALPLEPSTRRHYAASPASQ